MHSLPLRFGTHPLLLYTQQPGYACNRQTFSTPFPAETPKGYRKVVSCAEDNVVGYMGRKPSLLAEVCVVYVLMSFIAVVVLP